MHNLVDYIKKYCDLGYKIFPVIVSLEKDGTVTKKPAITNWQTTASSDFDTCIKMFAGHCGIGLATGALSGVTVIDVDVKGSANGFLSLESNNIEFPITPTVQTPSGGRHYYFKYNPKIKSKVGILPGVDVRNDGSLIILPPTPYPNKPNYTFLSEQEPWN